MIPATHPEPARADVEDGHPEQGDRRHEPDLCDQRQAAVALDRPMDGEPGRAGARGLTLTGAGRPVDGGRGRTCVCRGSRRVVIGGIVARRRKQGPRACVLSVGDGVVRCTLARSRVRFDARATGRERSACELAIRGPGRQPSGPTGRPAFGVGPIARVSPSPLTAPAGREPVGAGARDGRDADRASACRTCGGTSARTST